MSSGLPFLAPLKDWVKTKLETREKNTQLSSRLSPFIILSSAAVVLNDTPKGDGKSDGADYNGVKEAIKSLVKDGKYSGVKYYGCIVANTTDTNKLYQTANTIVGYDLNGKAITVDGETNRRVSVPIITSLEIDTQGGNNTVKTARLDIMVFTLKQLEMLELFFLRPGMNVVLEYGNNADITTHTNEINSRLFANKNYENYKTAYTNLFTHGADLTIDNPYKNAKESYLKTLKQTDGNYDFMAGKVANFRLSPDASGAYKVNLEISAGNELQLWMPLRQSEDKSTVDRKSKKDTPLATYGSWVSKIASDFGLPVLFKELPESKWKNEFFNWGIVVGKDAKGPTFSKEPYISMRLIIELINHFQVFKTNNHLITVPYYTNKDKKESFIPISSNKYIMSSSDDIIFPGFLPSIKVSTAKETKDQIIIDKKEKHIDARINGYSFSVSADVIPKEYPLIDQNGNQTTIDASGIVSLNGDAKNVPSTVGNLLNVFIKYSTFLQMYDESYVQADLLNKLLDLINDSIYGLASLELSKPSDTPGNEPLTIIDTKISAHKPNNIDKNSIYRFKIGPIGSIIQDFNFNMELSSLMQAQALYSSQLALNSLVADGSFVSGSVVANTSPITGADFSYQTNSDGYYSINTIELAIVKDAAELNNKQIKDKPGIVTKEEVAKDANGKPIVMSDVLQKKFTRFRNSSITDKNGVAMIYDGQALILNALEIKTDDTVSALTQFDITIGIDGLAGLSCGEFFYIDGVPEIYNKNGYFQITNVKHGISDAGWKTTIEAGYRIDHTVK